MTDTTLPARNAMARSPVRKHSTEPSERTHLIGISCESVDALLVAARRGYSWGHLAKDTRD
jgi:hypothetical protein